MALMSEHTARSSLVIGILELVFGVIAVICGIVSVSNFSSSFDTTIGMWAFYFAIPGILCILTGVKKEPNMMRRALAANIIGTILALVAFIIGAVIWANCSYFSFFSGCGHLIPVTAVVTIVYAILGIVCFIGFIYGCSVTCCAPNAPTVSVTCTVPQPNTIAVTNQTNEGQPMAYVQGQPMAYPQGQPMAYPQGQPMAYPQGQPMAYPEGQPMAFPQGQPMAYPQGQEMAYPQGQPMAYGQAAYPGTAQQQPPAYSDSQINPGVQYVGKQ